MQSGTIQNLALKINAFLVLLQTFHYQSFYDMWVLILETKVHDPQLTYQNLDYQVMLESPISKILP